MKILIVGCGIGGLAIYRALKKHLGDTAGITIKVVDSHELPMSHVMDRDTVHLDFLLSRFFPKF